MESFFQDIKFALRLLWKDKGFAITAITTLALCIAANAAIFSVVNSVIFKPLPFQEPERLITMYNSYPNAGVKRAENGAADYVDRRKAITACEDVALYNTQGLTIGEAGSVQRVEGMNVTPSLFHILRSQPMLGRSFTEEEGELGHERRVILSYGLWKELYGGNPDAIGENLRIYGNPFIIVGVMPKDFAFQDPKVRLWRPLAFTDQQKQAHHSNSWDMIGRLKPGETVEQAQAQVDALNRANMDLTPELKPLLINVGFHTVVANFQNDLVSGVRKTLFLLWGGVLFVLLIGAVNIANLVLARSTARIRELATRFALGAGRGRVTRQLITESVVLTLCSACLGLLLGYWGLRVLNVLGADQLPRGNEIRMDTVVVFFVLGLAFVVGLFIAAIPVVHAMKTNLSDLLRSEGRTGTSGRGARLLRKVLVVSQVAFALILLMGAGLLLASFRRVLAINPGFVSNQVLTGTVALPKVQYPGDKELRAFMDQALQRIRALPGVAAAGATDTIPMGGNYSDSVIMAEGYQMKPGESLISPQQIVVTPGYFEAMRVPLIEGRLFDESDTATSPHVLVIDQQLAHKFWPHTSPLGKRMWQPNSPQDLIQPGKDARWYTVVGVVGNMKTRALVDSDARVGAYYYPYEQNPDSMMTFAIRTAGASTSVASAVRGVITGLDSGLPLYDVAPLQERLQQSLVERKSPMLLAMVFAGVALLLAGVGIYGVLAYTVTLRTKEIGIRMALGGTAERIFKLILQEGILILVIGFGLGLVGTLALDRYLQSILYGVKPFSPFVLASVTGALAITGIIACLVPAQRATRIDPVVALRQE